MYSPSFVLKVGTHCHYQPSTSKIRIDKYGNRANIRHFSDFARAARQKLAVITHSTYLGSKPKQFKNYPDWKHFDAASPFFTTHHI